MAEADVAAGAAGWRHKDPTAGARAEHLYAPESHNHMYPSRHGGPTAGDSFGVGHVFATLDALPTRNLNTQRMNQLREVHVPPPSPGLEREMAGLRAGNARDYPNNPVRSKRQRGGDDDGGPPMKRMAVPGRSR